MKERHKAQARFVLLTFLAFEIVEFLVANWLHWWRYGSFWAMWELPFFCSLQVFLGWLLWVKMEFRLLRLSGGRIVWERK